MKGEIIKWYGTATNIDTIKATQASLEESQDELKQLNQNLENLIDKRTEQVRLLSKALTLAEQRERKQFSYVLHENLQQLLFGAKILLSEHLKDHISIHEENDDLVQGLKIIDKALHTTKSLSIELNPPILPSQGLDVALDWLIGYMQTSYGLSVKFNSKGPLEKIKNENQLMFTQMVRELLSNVIKHAGVSKAILDVELTDRNITIDITDNGRGFDTSKIIDPSINSSKLGLFSVRERLKFFGGTLNIKSEIGAGTKFTIILPIGFSEV